MSLHTLMLKVTRVFGAALGFGGLAAFLYLIGVQVYRWFRQGEWTHVGVSDGLHLALLRCCVRDGDVGRLASLAQWLDTPVEWLGLHKVFEVVPASLALFLLSILGNALYIYSGDRVAETARNKV